MFRRDRTAQAPTVDAFALVAELAVGDLLTGVRDLPPGFQPGTTVTLATAATLTFLTTAMPDGTTGALQVFTTEAALRARSPHAVPLREPGRAVLIRVVHTFAGLVVDSAGPTPRVLTAAAVQRGLAALG